MYYVEKDKNVFAHHEAGHAVLGYLNGDYIKQINLNFSVESNKPAFVEKIYGRHKIQFCALATNTHHIFSEMDINLTEYITLKYCMDLLAGLISENIYKNQREFNKSIDFLQTSDIVNCKQAINTLTTVNKAKDYSNFFNDCVKNTELILDNNIVSTTIELLVVKILNKSDLILFDNEIYESFKETGLIELTTEDLIFPFGE